MKTKFHFPLLTSYFALSLFAFCLSARAQGTAFTYQGRLNDGANAANGTYDLQFAIYDAASAGNLIAGPRTNSATGITNGLFAVTLDFSGGVFTGAGRWLDISVRTNTGGGGSFVTLTPRQQLTPTPYAILAGGAMNLQSGGVTGFRIFPQVPTISGSNVVNVAGGSPINVASGIAATVAGGGATVSGFDFANRVIADWGTIGGGIGNYVISGYGTIAGGFNNQATGQPGATVGGGSQNQATGAFATVAGGEYNVASGYGAFIGGGGADGTFAGPNSASGNAAVVVGGVNNSAGGYSSSIGGGAGNNGIGDYATVAGGTANTVQTSASSSTIGGGANNLIQTGAQLATIAGGHQNIAGSFGDTVSGGESNVTSASYSTVGGGFSNQAVSIWSTVPGGANNLASGFYSFAAGHQAQALHQGSFVWADSQNAAFASTTNDQFSVRAQGGMRLDNSTSMFFGTGAGRQMLNLWGTQYGIGVQSYTTYFRTDNSAPGGDFAWYQGGVHNDGQLNPGGGKTLMVLDRDGSLHVTNAVYAGSVMLTSDRRAKENFTSVDTRALLEKVTALPLTEWNFKTAPATRHIGPMAQDFQAAFQVGEDDTHIAVTDEGGVALAAIQGLNEKVEGQSAKEENRIQNSESRIQKLESDNTELKRENEALEKRLEAIEQSIHHLSSN